MTITFVFCPAINTNKAIDRFSSNLQPIINEKVSLSQRPIVNNRLDRQSTFGNTDSPKLLLKGKVFIFVLFFLPDPRQWSEAAVAHWLHWAIREFSLEGVAMQPWQHMTGKQICAMGKESFLARAPAFMGDILWEHLEILQKGACSSYERRDRIRQSTSNSPLKYLMNLMHDYIFMSIFKIFLIRAMYKKSQNTVICTRKPDETDH